MSEPAKAEFPHYSFAVPIILLRTFGFAREAAQKKWQRKATLNGIFTCTVRVFAYRRRMDAERMKARIITAMNERGVSYEVKPEIIEGRSLDVCFMRDPEVREVVEKDFERQHVTDGQEVVAKLDMKMFELLSAVTGCRIDFNHFGGAVRAPQRGDERTITYFAHARPPGVREPGHSLLVKDIDGLPVWTGGGARCVLAVTKGRGRIVSIGGAQVLQVLGRNYYQLQLTYSEHHDSANRAVLIMKIANALLQDLEENPSPAPFTRSGERSVTALHEFAEGLVGRQLESVRKEAKEVDFDIIMLQEKLAEKLLEQRNLAVTMNALRESSLQEELRKRLPGELSALRKLDGITRVEVVEEGIHLTTEPIVLEHEGERYPMGVFTIRLDPQNCKVEAWTDAPLHPDGHHHPHVGKIELSCYGNVGLALIKAMAAYRYLDAGTITMRWLRSYNEATTLYRIEEWLSESMYGEIELPVFEPVFEGNDKEVHNDAV
jgi:hypothetical protein